MALKDALLPEFDHEMAVTRRVLERVPFQDVSWRPHPRSTTLGGLASHLADIPQWTGAILNKSGYDIGADGNGNGGPTLRHASLPDLLESFDRNIRAARELLREANDARLLEPWTLKDKGQEVFTLPKVATLRSFVFSHVIHHRGQMSVYLRMRDVPVPSIYGPSADER
jgi:uncharacterized damage-inducible protein DinB